MSEPEKQVDNARFLIGKKVYLRPIEPEDLILTRKWSNDPEIRDLVGETLPVSKAGANEWLDKIYKDKDRVWFVIVLNDNDRVIGEGGFLRIYHPWRSSDISIILGEKDAQGKEYGTEAMHLMLRYGFGTLNLHRISLGVFDFNKKAIRFYEKVGFKKEGVQRDGYYYDNAYHDVIMMSILENEFWKLHKKEHQ
jgi:RimJ/RimL family protein N-acetyltransferase